MNANAVAIVLHLLSAVVWVGGMIFAHACLRPVAVSQLEPPQRLPLWVGVFARFFPLVWLAVILLPLSGYLMIFTMFGGMGNAPLYVHLMNGIGSLMILIYLYVYFFPYRQLRRAVTAQQWPAGGDALARIRRMVGTNIILGLIVIAVASGGRYLG